MGCARSLPINSHGVRQELAQPVDKSHQVHPVLVGEVEAAQLGALHSRAGRSKDQRRRQDVQRARQRHRHRHAGGGLH